MDVAAAPRVDRSAGRRRLRGWAWAAPPRPVLAALAWAHAPASAQDKPLPGTPGAIQGTSSKADRRAEEKQRRARPGNLVGHGGPVKALAVDAASGRALTGSFDYAMMGWDIARGDAAAAASSRRPQRRGQRGRIRARRQAGAGGRRRRRRGAVGPGYGASSRTVSRGIRRRSWGSPYPRTAAGPHRRAGTAPRASGIWQSARRAPCSRAIRGRSTLSPFPQTPCASIPPAPTAASACGAGRRDLPAAAASPRLGHQRAGAHAGRRAPGLRRAQRLGGDRRRRQGGCRQGVARARAPRAGPGGAGQARHHRHRRRRRRDPRAALPRRLADRGIPQLLRAGVGAGVRSRGHGSLLWRARRLRHALAHRPARAVRADREPLPAPLPGPRRDRQRPDCRRRAAVRRASAASATPCRPTAATARARRSTACSGAGSARSMATPIRRR